MAAVALLAVVLAVAALGAAAVAGLELRRQVGHLRAGVDAATGRLRPLVEEVTAEAAVTAIEVEAVRGAAGGLTVPQLRTGRGRRAGRRGRRR